MKVLKATPASPGIIIGRAYHARRTKTEVVYQEVIGPGQVVSQLHALNKALETADEELNAIRTRVETDLPSQVVLIDAHLMILRDPMFVGEARRLIEEEQVTAAWAVVGATRAIAKMFAQINDPYLSSRIEDVEAAADRILRALSGVESEGPEGMTERAILVTDHLSPADTTQLNVSRVMGFVTEMGGRTSHTAIVAQALELPAVVGLEDAMTSISGGSLIILDGTHGRVIIDPDEETLIQFQELQDRYSAFIKSTRSKSHLPARTRDGMDVTVQANIEQAGEVGSAIDQGAEGIGLFRSEFLYLAQPELPGEEQLYQAYRQVAEAMDQEPVTIRTLDLGGDKFAHQFNLVPEMNPAMGLRAVRLCLRRPDIFKTQLKAILRASVHGRMRLMFPMISGVQEFLACREILDECRAELTADGIPFDHEIPVGCMMEVPSAVVVADLLAREVDFFSIGTNDLIQYSLAIDRVNEYVAHMYRPFHPAVLRMIRSIIQAGRAGGIPVSMCGEMASEAAAIPLLLGLGLDELSVNPQAVPRVKQVVRAASQRDCAVLTEECLAYPTEKLVSEHLRPKLAELMPETFGPDGLLLY